MDTMAFFNNTQQGWLTLSRLSLSDPAISDDMRVWMEAVLGSLIFAFASLGVITNAINIRVFVQQGVLSDSSTIALFSLAIADFAGCLSEVPGAVCQIVEYTGTRPVYLSCLTLTAMVCHTPHVIMSRITCLVTVYIAIERSICVLLPFKVKRLLHPKVTATAMTLIYAVVLGAYIPFYVFTKMSLASYGSDNVTYMKLTEGVRGAETLAYLSIVFNTVVSFTATGIVFIATALMLYKLFQSTKWRQSTSGQVANKIKPSEANNSDNNYDNITTPNENAKAKKDMEVLRTVTMVTALFLVCLTMNHIPGMATFIVPDVTATGLNLNLFYVAYYYKIVFDLINSSLNIFFYLHTSSRYKKAFNEVFRKATVS